MHCAVVLRTLETCRLDESSLNAAVLAHLGRCEECRGAFEQLRDGMLHLAEELGLIGQYLQRQQGSFRMRFVPERGRLPWRITSILIIIAVVCGITFTTSLVRFSSNALSYAAPRKTEDIHLKCLASSRAIAIAQAHLPKVGSEIRVSGMRPDKISIWATRRDLVSARSALVNADIAACAVVAAAGARHSTE